VNGTGMRRERLANPWALALAAAAFVGAFVLLAPARDAFSPKPAPSDTVDAALDAPIDDLRLAYLKARGVAGELEPAEALASAVSLVRDGRVGDARALLQASPALVLGPIDRTRLDLELAAGELRRARARASGITAGRASDVASGSAADDVAAAESVLSRALTRLLGQPTLHERQLLVRAATLAAASGDARLPVAVHARLATVDPARALVHLEACGEVALAGGLRSEAVDCLSRARVLADAPARRFALSLQLMTALPPLDADGRRRALVEEALAHRPTSTAELEALGKVLLSVERPDAAARVHARLAESDPRRRVQWLAAAARWSEAAGRPAEAAVFLDAMPTPVGAEAGVAHRRRIEALLVGAGRSEEALDRVAVRVNAAPNDRETVREAVAMARRAGDAPRALGWNTQLLSFHPNDAEALRRQVDLALAVGRPDLARPAAERALAAAPDDTSLLGELARLAEWTGDPEQALRRRLRLAELMSGDDTAFDVAFDAAGDPEVDEKVDVEVHSAQQGENLREIARLAESLRRPAVAADALRTLALTEEPDATGVRRLVRLYELDGRPRAAVATLDEIMVRHGERPSTLLAMAELQGRHLYRRPALATWQRLARRFGRSGDETLARTELHWRLEEPDAAASLATDLVDLGFGSTVSDYQAGLLAEIGWRYRLPAVAALARPLIATLASANQRLVHGRRAIDAYEAEGDLAGALREAETRWRSSGSPELALTALRLSIDTGDEAAASRLFDATATDDELLSLPVYHSLRAVAALRRDDAAAARRAYGTALGIDADNVEAIAGLLWLHIGEGDVDAVAGLLEREAPRARETAALWVPFAVGHVEIGEAAASLPWFERALGDAADDTRADYGLILTWADALEAAGRLDHARRVRRFAVAELRPGLLDAAAADRETLLRQYGRVLARHGGSEANESWMRYVLADADGVRPMDDRGGDDETSFWREDMAIAWLMATERHEHARLLMARRHERRLEAPVWQDLALAMRADDEASVQAMLDAGTGLSAGDRILALRKLGRDADAWTLAVRTLGDARTPADRRVASEQYAAMKRFRPRFASALTRRTTSGDLAIEESGVGLRYTLGASALGVGVDVVRGRFDSDTFTGEETERSGVVIGLYRESTRQDVGIRAGVLDDGDRALVHGDARYARRDALGRREASVEIAWNEAADESAELRLAGKRNRAGVSLETSIGARAFARLSAEASEISTRVDDRRLARGLATRAELGLRGGLGGIAWSSSVVAADVRRDRVDRLPLELRLGQDTTLDGVLPESARTLSLLGSLSRGGVGGNFPDTASPRYYLNGGLSHAWPEQALGLQLDAGVGMRVLGNDELALAFVRDTRLSGRRNTGDLSSIGLSYRHHF